MPDASLMTLWSLTDLTAIYVRSSPLILLSIFFPHVYSSPNRQTSYSKFNETLIFSSFAAHNRMGNWYPVVTFSLSRQSLAHSLYQATNCGGDAYNEASSVKVIMCSSYFFVKPTFFHCCSIFPVCCKMLPC